MSLGRVSLARQSRLWSFTLPPPLAGEAVSVVGFGVFGQACGPSVTSGILSAVVQVDDTPVMLQTTCAVHGGSSGGPLFSTCSGDLLGKHLFGPLSASPGQILSTSLQGLALGATLYLGRWCPYAQEVVSQGFQAVLLCGVERGRCWLSCEGKGLGWSLLCY